MSTTVNTFSTQAAAAATPCCANKKATAAAAKPIISKRFKTTLCQSFEKTGRCPYVSRCMFAHGRRELRTAEQNVADGLTTDEAIKEWKQKRAEAIALKKGLLAPAATACCRHANADGTQPNTPPSLPIEGASTPSTRPSTPGAESKSPVDSLATSTSVPTTPQVGPRGCRGGWRHDPYSVHGIPMLMLESSSPLAAAFGCRPRAASNPSPAEV